MINRKEAIEKLSTFFNSLYSDKVSEEKLYSAMSKRGMNRGRFNGYVFNMIPLDNFSDEELYWFASYKQSGIDVEEYFSEEEQKKYSKSKVRIEKKLYPVIFENVIPVSDDQFVTIISTQKLYELYNNSVLAYNIRTQRAPKIYYKDGKEVYKININRYSVNEIRDLMERGLYIYNDLSFNVGSREENNFYYDEQKAQFVLKDGIIDILDGFHRTMAIIQVMNSDPEFEQSFVLNIMNFTEEKARRFVAQQDKRNKINMSFAKSLDDTKYDSIIVKRLNENSNCVLFGQIKAVGKRQLDFGKTAGAIKFLFAPKTMKDANEITRQIENGTNVLLSDGLPASFSDYDMKILLSYVKAVGDMQETKEYREGYEKLKVYLVKHKEETKSINTIRRAARSIAKN